MTTMAQAALTASVLVGLISIPAVSKSATSAESIKTDIPDVSNTESVPEEITRTTSPDGFHASINTAFESFRTSVTPDKINITLENAGSDLEMTKTSETTRWELTTSTGTLVITESPEKTVEKVSTPEGTLVVKKSDGSITEKFSGSDRSQVEAARNELKQVLEQRKNVLDEKRDRLKKTAIPDVELIANESTADGYGNNTLQHVVIRNQEPEPLEIDGWTLKNNNLDGGYTFKDLKIPAGEKLLVYTSDEDTVGKSEKNAVYGTGLAWENAADTATLFNSDGVEVEKTGY